MKITMIWFMLMYSAILGMAVLLQSPFLIGAVVGIALFLFLMWL